MGVGVKIEFANRMKNCDSNTHKLSRKVVINDISTVGKALLHPQPASLPAPASLNKLFVWPWPIRPLARNEMPFEI